jgi:hypothetical protein
MAVAAATDVEFQARHRRFGMSSFVAMVTVASLLTPQGPPSKPPSNVAAAQAPAAAETDQTEPVDGGWPRIYVADSGAELTLHEPQVASWVDQKHIVMYVAVSYLPKGEKNPTLGTIRVEAETQVALAERLVNFGTLTITSANFPTMDRAQVTGATADIVASVPLQERIIGLDRVLAALDASQVIPRNVPGIKGDPPVIFVSRSPGVLVSLDGEPIWSPIKDNDLRFAVNTNWDLFEHAPSGQYYLRVDQGWLQAAHVDGPWRSSPELPSSFSRLPDDENWKDVRAALRAGGVSPAPSVYVSKRPAELILIEGEPEYVQVTGTNLFWLSNTESDVFRFGTQGPIYYLVSGRWFSAATLSGPWSFATPALPDDFKRIPLEHDRSRVLASVPGTTQALEAVVLAQIPQRASVRRNEIVAPAVDYHGEPQFEAIENTQVARAVNTEKDVLKVGDLYYLCVDGVWFVSSSPSGPWAVTGSVPGEIYEIPPSSPSYHVTHVTVESEDDDEVVFAAAAAYTGMMVAWGCAVWGTGYYYPPYYWGGGYYPIYYPRYPSYGYGARYNPWTGAYTRAGVAYGPYGGAGYAARYNPRTGTYSRGAAAWGPGGVRGAAEAWNPRTGTAARTRQGANVYGSWGSTAVRRGDDWAATARVTRRETGTTSRVTQGSGGGTAVTRRGDSGRSTIARSGEGDIYAGRDGNVYRNDGDGWQRYQNGDWSNVERTTAGSRELADRTTDTRANLEQDRERRAESAQRTRDLSSVRSGSSRSGSYRPSGGSRGVGSRGGGGRRR